MNIDRDLQSIQEVRDLVAKAKEAEKTLCTFPQEKLDAICASIASACMEHAEELAKMAVQETGFGKWEDKVLKNKLGSAITWESVKNMKTVGVLRENEETKVTEIGVPMGVVAALIPSTNPTSTVMYKSIISIKAGNAIVISPHPGAKNCITATYKIVKEAAERAGAPEGTVNCVSLTTVQATDALLNHPCHRRRSDGPCGVFFRESGARRWSWKWSVLYRKECGHPDGGKTDHGFEDL